MNLLKFRFLILSLPVMALFFHCPDVLAALRVDNHSQKKAQINMSIERATAAAASMTTPQPARTVTNENGETMTVSDAQMDACSAIYPNGVFDWVRPTIGTKAGAPATCVALVELRAFKNLSGTEYTVLARDYLAAGDSVKCNVGSFRNLTVAGQGWEYPADSEPTIEDVEKVMAEENKQNAGFKILGATLVAAIGGNMLTNDGTDSTFGTSSEKLKGTAIGALGGAALMTASTQVNDYKAANIILSTGVNAAAGAVAGNLSGKGDDVLRIAPCKIEVDKSKIEKTCMYGLLKLSQQEGTTLKTEKEVVMIYDIDAKQAYKCEKDENDKLKNCYAKSLTKILFQATNPDKCGNETDYVSTDCINNLKTLTNATFYKEMTEDKKDKKSSGKNLEECTGTSSKYSDSCKYLKIVSGTEVFSDAKAVMIPLSKKGEDDVKNLFGYKMDEYNKKEDKSKLFDDNTIYDTNGQEFGCFGEACSGKRAYSYNDFTPAIQSADDDIAVDFDNKARTKATMVGASAGGALGAISGVASANTAIQERWQTASREYKDSLLKYNCSTGGRYLEPYNSVIILPEMKTEE